MNNFILKKRIFPILVILFLVVLCKTIISHSCIKYPILDTPTNNLQIMEDVLVEISTPNHRPKDTIIQIIVTNGSVKSYLEAGNISIEQLYNNDWYSLKKIDSEKNFSAYGTPLPKNEETIFDVLLSEYGTPLKKGRYRVVVDIYPDSKCSIAEFDIT